jgi:calreticulin
VLICTLCAFASATVYFREDFDSPNWADRWVQSEHSGKEFGKFEWSAGKFYGDDAKDKGIKTSEDARFYALSSKFEDAKFSNEGKDLVIQFSVKHEQNIDCGGGYIKVFDCSLDQKNLHGETPYALMFGPDICGPAQKKVHAIFNYKGKNLLTNKDIRCKDDVHTHLYRLVVKPDNSYKVLIDGEVVEKGELEKDWSFLPPQKIKDPEAKKPEDWDDKPKMEDPTDTKPDDWEKPEYIADPEATKPEDWDDEMDGEWEPPQISNPEYKGEWKAKQIDNPNYKGPWVHPEIDNPEYVPDDKLYRFPEICSVGFDLWQVKAGTIFDNVLITDSEKEADEVQADILERVKLEKKMKEKLDEEERKTADAEKKDDDDEDKEDDDDKDLNELPEDDDAKEHDEL